MSRIKQEFDSQDTSIAFSALNYNLTSPLSEVRIVPKGGEMGLRWTRVSHDQRNEREGARTKN